MERKIDCSKKKMVPNGTNNLKEDQKDFVYNNKLILKIQQRFKSKRHNFFTEEINKIASRSNDDKEMQSIDSMGIYLRARI